MTAFTKSKPIGDNSMPQPVLEDAVTAAKDLIGWKLVHQTPEGRTAGIIVETEAYTADDPASHAYGGQRVRNAPMFKQAGTVYVYFTYGMHYCVNIVTAGPGKGEAVLIRALEPLEGIELMRTRRKTVDDTNLTNGPAKLTQAMGIGLAQNGQILTYGSVWLEPGRTPLSIMQTTRIGISKATATPWRYYEQGNPYVSRK